MSTFKKEEENKNQKSYEVLEFEKWDELKDINKNLLRGIMHMGLKIQVLYKRKSIIINGKDLIYRLNHTAKTGAFTIGLLNSIDISKNKHRRWFYHNKRIIKTKL